MVEVNQRQSLPVHPTQIYMILGTAAITVYLLLLERQKKADGQLFFSYLLSYGVIRAIVEIFRDAAHGGDSVRIFGWLTVSQIISIGLIALGGYGLHLLRKRMSSVNHIPSENKGLMKGSK